MLPPENTHTYASFKLMHQLHFIKYIHLTTYALNKYFSYTHTLKIHNTMIIPSYCPNLPLHSSRRLIMLFHANEQITDVPHFRLPIPLRLPIFECRLSFVVIFCIFVHTNPVNSNLKATLPSIITERSIFKIFNRLQYPPFLLYY